MESNGPFYAEGRYAVKFTGQGFGKSSTGNPQFILRFKVLGKVDAGDPGKYVPAAQQYERTHYRSITDKSADYFAADMRSLGFAGDSFRLLDPSTPGFFDLNGRDGDMNCEHRADQNGEQRENWGVARSSVSVLKIDKPLEAADLRKLDALFAKALAKAPKQAAKESDTKQGELQDDAPPPAPDDDSVPF